MNMNVTNTFYNFQYILDFTGAFNETDCGIIHGIFLSIGRGAAERDGGI